MNYGNVITRLEKYQRKSTKEGYKRDATEYARKKFEVFFLSEIYKQNKEMIKILRLIRKNTKKKAISEKTIKDFFLKLGADKKELEE